MQTPNESNAQLPGTQTQLIAEKPKFKMIKLQAVSDLKIPEKFFVKDANPLEVRDISKGTVFSVPENYAKDLLEPISGYPRFQGSRDEGDVEVNQHVRAKLFEE